MKNINNPISNNPITQNKKNWIYWLIGLLVYLFVFTFPVFAATNSIWQGDGSRKVVALTFDDGPKPEYSLKILETLQKEGVRATFFVVGEESEQNPDVIFQMSDFGHEIGNHSYTAETLTSLPGWKVENYLTKTNKIIEGITGKKVKYMRPPGGASNKVVAEESGDLGLTMVFWSINASDYIAEYQKFRVPDNYEVLAEDLVKKVMDEVHPGAIILFHNGSGQTIVALPEIIQQLRAKGYGFVTISELLEGKV